MLCRDAVPGARLGGDAGDPAFEPLDLASDLIFAGSLEEPLEHGLGVEQAEVDPEQPVQARELKIVERLGTGAAGELLGRAHLLGDLAERGAALAEVLEPAKLARQEGP